MWSGNKSILKTKIQTENSIALDITIPERIKDSIKAKINIAIHANSLFELKNDSILLNI